MGNIVLCVLALKEVLKNETGKIADEIEIIIERRKDVVAEDKLADDAKTLYKRIEGVGQGIYVYALDE